MDANDLFSFLAPASKVAHTSSEQALAKKRKKDKRARSAAAASDAVAPEASGSGTRSLSPEEEAAQSKKKARVSQVSDDDDERSARVQADPMASLEASGSGSSSGAMAVDAELTTPGVEQQEQQDAPLPVVADEFSEETARVVEPSKAGLSAPVPEGEQAEGGGIKLTHQVRQLPLRPGFPHHLAVRQPTRLERFADALRCPPLAPTALPARRSATASRSRRRTRTRPSRSTSSTTRPRGRTRSSSTRSRRCR